MFDNDDYVWEFGDEDTTSQVGMYADFGMLNDGEHDGQIAELCDAILTAEWAQEYFYVYDIDKYLRYDDGADSREFNDARDRKPVKYLARSMCKSAEIWGYAHLAEKLQAFMDANEEAMA